MLKLTVFFFYAFISSSAHSKLWSANKDHSEVLFQVPYMSVSEVTGRFNEFKAEAILSPRNHSITSVNVQLSVMSLDTGNKMRDGHLRSADFLNGNQHPYIVFKSSSISSANKNSFSANGTLTIKGISKPATISFSTTDDLKDTWGYENRFVKFKSLINRRDYGITWNKALDGKQLLVGDNITFWGTFQMQPSTQMTPNSKHMIPDTEYIRKRDLERVAPKEESALSKKLRNLINGK